MVNISLKWFKLSVSKDLVIASWHAMLSDVDFMMVVMFPLITVMVVMLLVMMVVMMVVLMLVMMLLVMMSNLQVMTNALSRSLVNFALGGRTVESATRKFLVSCWL